MNYNPLIVKYQPKVKKVEEIVNNQNQNADLDKLLEDLNKLEIINSLQIKEYEQQNLIRIKKTKLSQQKLKSKNISQPKINNLFQKEQNDILQFQQKNLLKQQRQNLLKQQEKNLSQLKHASGVLDYYKMKKLDKEKNSIPKYLFDLTTDILYYKKCQVLISNSYICHIRLPLIVINSEYYDLFIKLDFHN